MHVEVFVRERRSGLCKSIRASSKGAWSGELLQYSSTDFWKHKLTLGGRLQKVNVVYSRGPTSNVDDDVRMYES